MSVLAKWFRNLGGGRSGAHADWSPRLEFGVASLVGNVREHNEDSFYVPGWPAVNRHAPTLAKPQGSPALPGPDNLVLVADGMGGQLAGETASQMAVDLIPHVLGEVPADEAEAADAPRRARERIANALAGANRAILDASQAQGGRYARMGTTVVLAWFRGRRVHIANLGDSRAYRLRDGRLERLTKDHTMAQALVDARALTEDQLPGHKYQSVLYLHLGCPDADHGPEQVRDLELAPADRFILASDGLTGVLAEPQIIALLQRFPSPQDAAVALVDEALRNQSKDNITCIVADVR